MLVLSPKSLSTHATHTPSAPSQTQQDSEYIPHYTWLVVTKGRNRANRNAFPSPKLLLCGSLIPAQLSLDIPQACPTRHVPPKSFQLVLGVRCLRESSRVVPVLPQGSLLPPSIDSRLPPKQLRDLSLFQTASVPSSSLIISLLMCL